MRKSFLILIPFLLLFWLTTINSSAEEKDQSAIFAGGCFWCMEADFEKINGVKEVFPDISAERQKIRTIIIMEKADILKQ